MDKNIKKLTSGVVGINIADSYVKFNKISTNSTYTNNGNTISIGGVNYAVIDNSTVEMTNIDLKDCYESMAYAYNNSLVSIDPDSILLSMGNKPAFTQDNNSFINFKLHANIFTDSLTSGVTEYGTLEISPPILNDGDKYVTFERNRNNIDANDMYLPSRKTGFNNCVLKGTYNLGENRTNSNESVKTKSIAKSSKAASSDTPKTTVITTCRTNERNNISKNNI